jgi:hypothetical protein
MPRRLCLLGVTLTAAGLAGLASSQPTLGRVATFAARASLPPTAPDPRLWVPNGSVMGLARVGNTLYVGGKFSRLTPRSGPFVVVGGGDSAINAGAPEFAGASSEPHTFPADSRVAAVVGDGSGGWFVGGSFHWVGGRDCPALAHIRSDLTLDPAWCEKLAGSDVRVSALARSNNILFIAGHFTQVGGLSRADLAAVDVATEQTTHWAPTGEFISRLASDISALAASPSTVFVGYDANVIAFEATTGDQTWWEQYPAASRDAPSFVYALALGNGALYVGGANLSSIGGPNRYDLAALDPKTGQATDWNPHLSTRSAFGGVHAIVPSGAEVYVGGDFDSIGGASREGIAALDATTGKATSWNAHLNGSVYAAALARGSLFLGGSFSAAGGASRLNAAALDLVTGRASPWAPDPAGDVYALAPSAGRFALAGRFTGMGGVARTNLAAIDLTTDQPTPWDPSVGVHYEEVDALAVVGGRLYVAGTFRTVNGIGRAGLAAFDLQTNALDPWNPRIRGGAGSVDALAVADGRLYVGGDFSSIGGRQRSDVAAFALPGGKLLPFHPRLAGVFLNPVDAIAATPNTVYFSGNFERVDRQPRPGISAVDAILGRIRPGWKPSRRIAADLGIAAGLFSDLALAGKRIYVVKCGGAGSALLALSAATGKLLPSPSNTLNHGGIHEDECPDRVVRVGSDVVVGGSMQSVGANAASLHGAAILNAATGAIERWQPDIEGAALAITGTGSDLIVGGNFRTAGTLEQSYLARFGP